MSITLFWLKLTLRSSLQPPSSCRFQSPLPKRKSLNSCVHASLFFVACMSFRKVRWRAIQEVVSVRVAFQHVRSNVRYLYSSKTSTLWTDWHTSLPARTPTCIITRAPVKWWTSKLGRSGRHASSRRPTYHSTCRSSTQNHRWRRCRS